MSICGYPTVKGTPCQRQVRWPATHCSRHWAEALHEAITKERSMDGITHVLNTTKSSGEHHSYGYCDPDRATQDGLRLEEEASHDSFNEFTWTVNPIEEPPA